MNCDSVRELLGALLDGELPEQQQTAVRAHLERCSDCAREYASLQSLFARLKAAATGSDAKAPARLWDAIQTELVNAQARIPRHLRLYQFFRRPIAAAASLILVVGLGILAAAWLTQSVQTAQADVVDYSILLNNLSDDVNAAFDRFIRYYKAQPIDVVDVHKAAPALSFSLPPELPGGYRLEQVYRLSFGGVPGAAARYRRGVEPLMVFFHPPVNKEKLGTHREQPCLVGNTHGHQVEVGPWRLVHFTDPTTCHCMLSTLDVESELPAVFAAVAPKFTGGESGHGH